MLRIPYVLDRLETLIIENDLQMRGDRLEHIAGEAGDDDEDRTSDSDQNTGRVKEVLQVFKLENDLKLRHHDTADAAEQEHRKRGYQTDDIV